MSSTAVNLRPMPLSQQVSSEAKMETSAGVRFAQALVLSWVLALSAQISLPLPGTPVPVTAQSLVVLLAGAFLGSVWGPVAVGLYLAQGGLGLPIFSPGGFWGLARFLGPTGGYLLGFVAAAWIVGKLAERGWDRTPLRAAAMLSAGTIAIFAFGAAGLARFSPANELFLRGVYPFLLGELCKILIGAALVPMANSD